MIHIGRDGVQQGPYTQEQVNSMLTSGQLRPTDQAWREGLPGWVPLAQLEGVVLPGSGGAAAVPQGVNLSVSPAAEPPASAGVYAAPRSTLTPGATMGGQVSAATVLALKQTRPWVLLLAILGLIVVGLMLLGGLGMLAAGAFAGSVGGAGGAGGAAAPTGMPTALFAGMGVGYLLIAILYLYPIIKLFKFSGAISRLSVSGAVRDLEVALQQQKSFWKFVGILTLVMMVLYAIAIMAFAGSAMSAAGGMGGPPFGTPPSSGTAP